MVKAAQLKQLNDEINSDMEKIRTYVQKEEQKLVEDIQKMTPEEAKENVRIMHENKRIKKEAEERLAEERKV